MSLLAFRDVDSFYGRAQVLRGVSFEIGAGERVAILGRNGVGKTTVVNTFLGIASLGKGEITLAGKPSGRIRNYTAARAGISVVPQGRRIIGALSVKENLVLGSAVDRKGSWTLERVFNLFPILRERQDTSGTALSGGQQQMLAIGRALMANPALLVLDEPSEGLAPVIIDELADVFVRLAGEGTSLLLIEQHISLVRRVAQTYHMLSKGAVVESGTLAELTDEQLKRHVAV
ncbi:ABC transporter ATP-binding protein [Bosea lathyri]|jgi:branched-chain amino acid transport system ATP-binding protein|uniref:Amino acid/amide ABC transporter ATP-binding protein 2, HAAT family n=1 Tax=Bosea lathyri TaxID=1036778 RepID=A0A1H5S544_9HYPH|nr:ABC transporter ATP-binding protein [Bosea lathyri]SEF45736.1 amino acid/amide ABC transporter ATP-binding protein 2, HAAT family [Bosea lathyri]